MNEITAWKQLRTLRDLNTFLYEKMKTKAFTLVELLVVMVLIGILSGMTAVMLASAKTDAQGKKSARQIDLIEQILMSRISEMGFSPVPLVLPMVSSTPVSNAARLRLMARRDQLRMSFPDRRADLLHPPTALKYNSAIPSMSAVWNTNKIRPPAAWARMRTKLGLDRPAALPAFNQEIGVGEVLPGGGYEIWGRRNTADPTTHVVPIPTPAGNPIELPPGTTEARLRELWTLEHESAECLYLILAVTEFNGTPALDLLGNTFVANTDGDMVPEIVDAWGKPLGFIRWPVAAPFQDIQNAGPDAFDYLRSDHRFQESETAGSNVTSNDPINLTPMIVSGGADRRLGIRMTSNTNESISRLFSYATTFYTGSTLYGSTPPNYFYPDPFYNVAGGDNNIVAARSGGGMGATLVAEDVADNITNFGS